MGLEIGNKVAVLDDVIKGVVVKIESEIITFEDANGFHYKYHFSDLVKITKEQSDFLNSKSVNKQFLKMEKTSLKKQKATFTKYKNEISLEVDLHIEKLRKSFSKMNNYEILTLQLSVARAKLGYCIQRKIPRIIFIHGVGEGVLKSELHKLFKEYEVRYQDASYKKYGSGATEVFIPN